MRAMAETEANAKIANTQIEDKCIRGVVDFQEANAMAWINEVSWHFVAFQDTLHAAQQGYS